MEYPHSSRHAFRDGALPYDVAVVGAGPVGLAIAAELARMGLQVLVLDRRPPLADDSKRRPQLLVARPADLANLDHIGVDIFDKRVVSPLLEREQGRVNGSSRCVQLEPITRVPEMVYDVRQLANKAPVALVPIGELQRSLLERAVAHGAEIRYDCKVTRIVRHARASSLRLADAAAVRAKLVVIATGAARSLVEVQDQHATPWVRQMIGGVFDVTGAFGRFLRLEVPVRGYAEPVRCTQLQTDHESGAGTALLVDAPQAVDPSESKLRRFFAVAARACGLFGSDYLVAPQVFETSVTEVHRRVVRQDNRAPVVVVGDAAQTGHVFTGMNCFLNLALAIELCRRIEKIGARVTTSALRKPLEKYERYSQVGAEVLRQASLNHLRV